MTTAQEAAGAKTELAGDLAAGVNTLSLNQEVTFTKFVKVVLPLDGFVFWVRADQVGPSALYAASRFNAFHYNQSAAIVSAAPTLVAKGSLHYATTQQQNEDETVAVDQIVFTSLEPVQDFNQVGPSVIFIAEMKTDAGDTIKFAFSQRRSFYKQAGLHHYVGTAVYAALELQIIEDPRVFDRRLVVSNSLPIWLALNNYSAVGTRLSSPVQLYPSFAVPDNLPPPYGAVHIRPETTQALAAAPMLGPTLSHDQLAQETVRITIYGLRNDDALTFQDVVNQYSLDTDAIGIMNMPVIRDEKRTQSELSILAMKKSIEFDVNYYQSAARNIARQLILSAIPTFNIDGETAS